MDYDYGEIRDECGMLRRSGGDCTLCFPDEPSSIPEHLIEAHVLSPPHVRNYLRLRYIRDLRVSLLCPLCCVKVPAQFRLHVEGKKHQDNFRKLSVQQRQQEQYRPAPLPERPPPPLPAYRRPPSPPPPVSAPASVGFRPRPTAVKSAAAWSGRSWVDRPPPAVASPPAFAAPAAAASIRSPPAPSAPAASAESAMSGNLCTLCKVRVSSASWTDAARVATHIRGAQHRARLAMAQGQWQGEQSIRCLAEGAAERGVVVELLCNDVSVKGRELLLEVGRTYELLLCIDLQPGCTAQYRLNAVHLVPGVELPGLPWRVSKDRPVLKARSSRLRASVTPLMSHVSTFRALIVVCLSAGITVAKPLDIVVVPAGGQAAGEVIKPTSAYVPKQHKAPPNSHTRFIVIAGERPTSTRRARDMFVRPLEQFTVPDFISGGMTDSVQRKHLMSKLEEPLTPPLHAPRFHALLWLEEWQMTVDIQSYDTQAELRSDSRHRGLLKLSVPGLAENRPSVMFGDHVLVSDLAFDGPVSALSLLGGGSTAQKRPPMRVYSGYVHRVEQESVYLSFHNDFIRTKWVSGKAFNIRFTVNKVEKRAHRRGARGSGARPLTLPVSLCPVYKVPERRCHQAVKVLDANTAKRFFPLIGRHVQYKQTRVPAVVGVYSFLPRWSITATTSPAECDAWLSTHCFRAGARPAAVGLDTEFETNGDQQLQRMVLIQIATDSACLLFWLKDKEALSHPLATLLRYEPIAKYVVGSADADFLLQAYGVHLGGAVDVQRKVEQSLNLHHRPGLDKLVHAFRPDIPYAKVNAPPRTRRTLSAHRWHCSSSPAPAVLRCLSPQDKEMQRARFTWPLTSAMSDYAASDAILALLVGQSVTRMKPIERSEAWQRMISGSAEADGIVTISDAQPDERKAEQSALLLPGMTPLHFFNRSLNEPQQNAVRGVCAGLHHPCPYILFGPPGTGMRIQPSRIAKRSRRRPPSLTALRYVRSAFCSVGKVRSTLLAAHSVCSSMTPRVAVC